MNVLALALLLIQGLGSVDGLVVRAGSNDPLPETQILVAPVDRPLRESRVAATDAEGKFRIADLPASRYRLFFEHEGFIRGEYGERSAGKPGVELEIGAGRTVSGIVQPLTAGSVIYGRVVNATNDPLPNATVKVLKAAYRDGARNLQAVQSVQTNDLGEYRLFGLIPGNYFLSAIPAPSPTIQDSRVNTPSGNGTAISPLQNILATGNLIDPRALDGGTDLTVYFPGTTDPAVATSVDLKPGASFHAPDLRMVRARSFRIRGEIVEESGQPAAAEITTLTRAGAETPMRNAGIGPSRTFEFSGLLPGIYELNAADSGVNARKLGNMTITVSAENIENLRLIMRPAWTIKGRVVQEDPVGQPPSIRVQLRGSHGLGSLQPNPTAQDGTFTLTRIVADDYTLAFYGLPENVFVRSARLGGKDALNSTLLIDREVSDELEIVLSQKTGSLEAVVVTQDQKLSSATTVVLIPDVAHRHRFELFRTATTNSSGRATFVNVPPGNYSLFAWTDIEVNAWQDSDVMRQYEGRGISVTITEGLKGSAVVTAIE